MSDIAELRKRAMQDPQSLSDAEWKEILAFAAPKKDFYDEGNIAKVSSSGPQNKQRRKGWW